MSIQQKLSRFPVPEAIWDEYHLDQEINDRGIAVDMELVRQAIGMDARSKEKLTAQMRRLTDLENPNSVQQMKQWLADHGLEMDSLGKREVAALLKTAPAPLSEVLLLRQQLAKSSVKKYTAMATAVCPDGRARMQPLYFLITTAGTDTRSICYETHQKAKDILEGRKIDPTFYPVIFGADEGDDWTDPKVWKKANPSLGITVGIDKVRAACDSAKQNPAEENSFRQLRLNQWVKQAVRWMPMERWDKCAFAANEL